MWSVARYRLARRFRLLAIHPSIKEGTRLLSEIDKKNRTWVLFAALCYEQPVVLQAINPEADLADVYAKEEDQDVDGVAPAATQVVDMSQVMVVQDHWTLDNTALIGEVSSCLQGIDLNTVLICPPKTR